MKRPRPTEDALARLNALRANPSSEEAMRELRACLAGRSNVLAAKAAEIAGDCEIRELGPELVQAFQRFMAGPARNDKGCMAKTRIVKALYMMDCAERDVYLAGIRHVQMEPSFGPPVDTAAELRGLAALGLVRMGEPGVMLELVNLLADKQADARIGAVRALAYSGKPEATLVLRFKVLAGDDDAAVMGECFIALLALDWRESLPFVAGYLDSDDASLAEAAAVALGESRNAAAFEALRARWSGGAWPPLRRTLFLAMAASRQDAGVELLVSVVADQPESAAADALSALAVYRADARILERLESIARQRPELAARIHRAFAPHP